MLQTGAGGSIEICWSFPLTRDKFRMRCRVTVHQYTDGKANSAVLDEVWKVQSDDDKMSYRAAISGQVK